MTNNEKDYSLFVLLLMIGTSCIARTLKHQLNNNDRFHELTQKYSTMNLGCNVFHGYIYICSNEVDASGFIYSDFNPFDACNDVTFHANVNISNSTNDGCYFQQYSGDLTATVTPYYPYNSNKINSDNMTVNDIPSGVYNYTINGDMNLCSSELYLNLTLCNNGSCVVYDPIGRYAMVGENSTCTHYRFEVLIHSINKTEKYI